MPVPGLHVGIAAWIDRNRTYDGFAVVPPNPVPFTPAALLPIAENTEPLRLAELARMANLVPRRGSPAEPFGPGAPLWEDLVAVLDRMVFARRALDDADAALLQSARSVLYVDDGAGGLRTSPRFTAYLEMRAVVQTLQETGAAVEVQLAATSDWITLGSRDEVERALADVTRLGARSSVVEAMSCRAQLAPSNLLSAGDTSYASTSFHPLSAAQPTSWAVVEVPLAELSECVRQAFPEAPVAFASTSTTTCRFAYTTIDVVRPWPVTELLTRDDWKLSTGGCVSEGDGARGVIPAYVQTLYASAFVDPPSASPAPRPRFPPHGAVREVVRPLGPLRPFDPAAGPRRGVLATQVASVSPLVRPPGTRARDLALLQRFQVPLERPGWLARLQFAGVATPVGVDPPPAPAPESGRVGGTCVVGFGCVVVPAAPRPHEGYQW